MSVFISYNYDTAFKAAQVIAKQLEDYGVDVWWLPQRLEPNQVDMVVGNALDVCRRCIVIQSGEYLSDWQHTEIDRIQVRLKNDPSNDLVDFFLVIRIPYGDYAVYPQKSIPLLRCSEYINYKGNDDTIPELENIKHYFPGINPLVYKEDKKPFIHPRAKGDCGRSRWSFTGGFKEEKNNHSSARYCWLLLEDKKGKWYIQHPRPTITHAQRWIAPSVNIGPNIEAAVLIAASLEAHQQLIAEVLTSQWGALYPIDIEDKKVLCRQSKKHIHELNCILGEVEVIDRLIFPEI